MLPLHMAPGLLVMFMVMLAVVPLAIIWLDERRNHASSERLARLRQDVGLREHLDLMVRLEIGQRTRVNLPGA